MLRRRSSWKIGDAEEEVSRKIGDAEEEMNFYFARKIKYLMPSYSIIFISNLV
jgi:hypothetical protein